MNASPSLNETLLSRRPLPIHAQLTAELRDKISPILTTPPQNLSDDTMKNVLCKVKELLNQELGLNSFYTLTNSQLKCINKIMQCNAKPHSNPGLKELVQQVHALIKEQSSWKNQPILQPSQPSQPSQPKQLLASPGDAGPVLNSLSEEP